MKAIEAKTTVARTTFGRATSSRILVGASMVMVALGVGAAGGYIAAGLGVARVQTNNGIAPASTTVNRPAELPGYIVQEISPAPSPRLSQDSPEFIARYAAPARLTLKYGDYSSLPDWVVREITARAGSAAEPGFP